jgi:16S rRNA (adenine1518-N6/adenine1519-N6)-dimethyltransferase
VQLFGEAEYQFTIPAEAFYPKPKIDSALLKISCSAEAKIPVADMDVFFKLAKAGFGQKRKTLKNALSSNLALPSAITESMLLRAGIDPMRRAETLMIAEWHALLQAYNDHQQN